MVSTFDPRHNARLLCLEMLFELDFKINSNEEPSKTEENNIKYYPFEISQLKEYNEISSYNTTLLENIYKTVIEHKEDIDKLIQEYAVERPIKEINKIDLNILRISIAEVIFLKITPVKVAIDESIELAKEFGGIDNGGFVNGVLDQIFKKHI